MILRIIMLRKRVHLYTTARWLEPLGVKLDTERRPIYIYICSIGSVYVYDIYIYSSNNHAGTSCVGYDRSWPSV